MNMNNLVTLVAVAAVAVAVALIPVMPGVAVYDAIFKVQPTIPDPGAVPTLAGVHSLPSHVIVETIEVKVPKADRDRFIRTIKRDAIAAGGWTKVERSPLWANVFTVVVPESYLGRVDPSWRTPRVLLYTPTTNLGLRRWRPLLREDWMVRRWCR